MENKEIISWAYLQEGSNNSKELEVLKQELETIKQEQREKMESLEAKLIVLDQKLDKIIQSNKSLIRYFNEMHTQDARKLNFNIRSFHSSQSVVEPANFVPQHF